MNEKARNTEHSFALSALGLQKADVLACQRLMHLTEDAAIRTLLDSGVNGRTIVDVSSRAIGWKKARIVAATQVLQEHLTGHP